ncbi:MAG TPA: tripartite tricarboxylate transporter substrate binding protein [Xanthobacteraceae bacterium]|nr:tripartite tricarboxylate transporter substrate binding protein [Xanthobacteraceae bacterium]
MRKAWCGIVIAVAAAWASSFAVADDSAYPTRPVRIIVNVSPGGGVDTATRIVAQALSEKLGKPFVVENRPSASGIVGADAVYHADPDGYTLLSSSGSPLAIDGWLYKKLSYEPKKFEPIVIMSRIPNVLAVRNNLDVPDIKGFIAYAKANPDKLTYGTQGQGTASHLTTELFMSLTGTKLVHVPYKGSNPVINDLLAGQIDCAFLPSSTAIALAQAGKLRILAVATAERLGPLPQTPTFTEIGYGAVVTSTWNALSAPPGTPDSVLKTINSTVNAILAQPETRERFQSLQLFVAGGDLQTTKDTIARERKQWGDVVHAAGIEAE